MTRDKVKSALVEIEWLRKRLMGFDTYLHKVRDINQCRDQVLYYLFHVEGERKEHEVLYEYSLVPISEIEGCIRIIEKWIIRKCDEKTRREQIDHFFERLLVHVKYNFKLLKIKEDVEYEINY